MTLLADQLTSRVVIVEDHRMVADNLALALRAGGADAVVASDFRSEAVVDLCSSHHADVVVLDLQLGPDYSGRPLIAPLTSAGARVIVVSGVTDKAELAKCAEAGAVGIVGKNEPFARLVDTVERVLEGGEGFREGERDQLLADARKARHEEEERLAPFRRLTAREKAVLRLLVRGLQAEAIAERSYVSLATVRSQIRSVLVKLGVNSQLAAVAMAAVAGWDGDDEPADSSI